MASVVLNGTLVLEISLILIVIPLVIPMVEITLALVSIIVSLILETLILRTLMKPLALIEVTLVMITLVHSRRVLIMVLVWVKTRWARVVVRTVARVHRRTVLVTSLMRRTGYGVGFKRTPIGGHTIIIGMGATAGNTYFHFFNFSRR